MKTLPLAQGIDSFRQAWQAISTQTWKCAELTLASMTTSQFCHKMTL